MRSDPPLVVRPARPADAAAMAAIYNEGIADRIATFETEPRTAEALERRLIERGTRYPTVVAERDGRIAGWAGASPYSLRECYAGIAEFSVYVQRAARGSGVGSAVMTALIAACEAAGCWKLVSRVFPENEGSLRLLRRLGFREVGRYRRHARLDGVWRDVVIVEKLLGEAADPAE